MWKNSLKNVEYDNNKILYEIIIDCFLQRNGTYFLNKPLLYIYIYIYICVCVCVYVVRLLLSIINFKRCTVHLKSFYPILLMTCFGNKFTIKSFQAQK